MVKNITLRRLILIFILQFISFGTFARTLKQISQSSNILLVLSDRLNSSDKNLGKKLSCGLNHTQISEFSQKLKIEVDQKMNQLSEKDFQIIQNRAKSCELDCSCDIYALALEKKQVSTTDINIKAIKITLKKRAQCISNILNICNDVIFKK